MMANALLPSVTLPFAGGHAIVDTAGITLFGSSSELFACGSSARIIVSVALLLMPDNPDIETPNAFVALVELTSFTTTSFFDVS
jgi:hypothetical protein